MELRNEVVLKFLGLLFGAGEAAGVEHQNVLTELVLSNVENLLVSDD